MIYLDFLIRISICFGLGLIIGVERQFRRRVAGMRTITLVALGSFLFVSVSVLSNPVDISRIAAQVVSGIGFLGAGVIIRDGTNIRGLNTAATLWCSAAVGTLTALGFVVEAVIGVGYILLSNILLRVISKKMMNKIPTKRADHYSLTILCDEEKSNFIKGMLLQKLKANQIFIKSFNTSKFEDNIKIETHIDIVSNEVEGFNTTINKLCLENGVNSVMFNKLVNYTDDDDDYEVK